jgi:hypothetical protein
MWFGGVNGIDVRHRGRRSLDKGVAQGGASFAAPLARRPHAPASVSYLKNESDHFLSQTFFACASSSLVVERT